jgi:small subunit ribosomal protein S10
MPTRRKIFCVLRSPHVNKDAREHFEIKTYKRLIDIQNSSLQTIDSLKQLNLPAGIDLCVSFI